MLPIVCLIVLTAQAQEPWTLYQPSDQDSTVMTDTVKLDTIRAIDFNKRGQVTIYKDSRIDAAAQLDKGPVKMQRPGYRVQIRLSQDREEINLLRAKFLKIYDTHTAHVQYDQPNFTLRVGDFYTRQQALEFKYEIAEHFPSAIVIEDSIELPKLDDN